MSRLRKYVRSLFSGYVALAANICFTLASTALILRPGYHLSDQEIGLFFTTTQLASAIALVDFGMSGASRILVDYKDRKASTEYGSLILTTVCVSVVQGILVMLVAALLIYASPGFLGIPGGLRGEFFALMLGQGVILAANFAVKILNYLLSAHQYYDLVNYSATAGFVGNFAVAWWALSQGQGVLSLVWGQAFAWLLTTLICLAGCWRLRLFPAEGCWGRPDWGLFRELFAFGRDIFLFMVGGQLLSASQTILITKMLGLEQAAVWGVCTRAFNLALQLIYRVFDFSCGALAEMIVRRENARLESRFKSIVVLSGSVAVIAATIFATCNQTFVHVWSHGKIGWSMGIDVLLALWMIPLVYEHAHVGLVGQCKDFSVLRHLYLVEGLFFIAGAVLFMRSGGVASMIIASILASLSFALPYGIRRTSKLFRLRWQGVAFGWAWKSLSLAFILVPCAIAVWWSTQAVLPLVRLMLCGGGLGLVGAWAMLRFGTEETLRRELIARCPRSLQPALRWIEGVQALPPAS